MLKPLIYAAIIATFVIQTANVPAAGAKTTTNHVVAINHH